MRAQCLDLRDSWQTSGPISTSCALTHTLWYAWKQFEQQSPVNTGVKPASSTSCDGSHPNFLRLVRPRHSKLSTRRGLIRVCRNGQYILILRIVCGILYAVCPFLATSTVLRQQKIGPINTKLNVFDRKVFAS